MPMNSVHRKRCSSSEWGAEIRDHVLPWALDGIELSGEVLEIGPGFGATTRVLADRPIDLTAVEVDDESAERLRAEFDGRARIVHGDGTSLPFEDASFDSVVCFTMLHHVPSRQLQDALFAEAARVLRPGGVFAGSDSRASLRLRLFHFRDTFVPLDPGRLPDRLRSAGLADPTVDATERRVRFRATRP